jgi:hypothetical protein
VGRVSGSSTHLIVGEGDIHAPVTDSGIRDQESGINPGARPGFDS